MSLYCGYAYLLLDIDGIAAEIPWEQKAFLFHNGLIFIQPEEVWSRILPPIDISIEGHFHSTLRNFIRSKTLVSLINEMNDVEVFKQKVDQEKTNGRNKPSGQIKYDRPGRPLHNLDAGKLPRIAIKFQDRLPNMKVDEKRVQVIFHRLGMRGDTLIQRLQVIKEQTFNDKQQLTALTLAGILKRTHAFFLLASS